MAGLEPEHLLPARHGGLLVGLPSGGVIFLGPPMRKEPANKRTIVFVDGQNLFYAAKEAFGYRPPRT